MPADPRLFRRQALAGQRRSDVRRRPKVLGRVATDSRMVEQSLGTMRHGAEAVGPDLILATLSLGIVRLKTGCCLNGFGGSCIHGYGVGIYPLVDVPLLIVRGGSGGLYYRKQLGGGTCTPLS
eukprot:9489584-Pyramimonas_sp.AAC.1